MVYPQVVDAFRSYWPGERPAPRAVLHLSLAEVYHGAQRTVEYDGRSVTLDLPPGVHSGARVYLPRTGHEHASVAEYCGVIVQDQPPFQRMGDDLLLEWTVDVRSLCSGCQEEVPTLAGPATLTIPAWTAPGTILRVAGRGLPILGRPGLFGDLCVHVHGRMPAEATDLERRLIADLINLQHWHVDQA
ncbi:MAG: hypothetical protein IT317_10175 [Anaerolineales bacterium]|nr:hypothetical protein [Anaerolineales bacterium]